MDQVIDSLKSYDFKYAFTVTKGMGIPYTVFMYPLYLLEIRRQVNNTTAKLGIGGGYVKNYWYMFHQVRSERGFYKGFTPCLLQRFVVDLLWTLPLFDALNKGNHESFFTIASIEFFIQLPMYPLILASNLLACDAGQQLFLKTNVNRQYKNIRDVFRQQYSKKGIRGLYKGLSLYMISSACHSLFCAFERFAQNEKDRYAAFAFIFFQYPIETLRLRYLITPNQDSSIKGIIKFSKEIVRTESIRSLFAGSIPNYTILLMSCLSYYKLQLMEKQEKKD